MTDPVIETYSKLADAYDDPANIASCWGRVAQHSLGLVTLRNAHKTVVEDRLKGAGRHWAPAHVDPMAALPIAVCADPLGRGLAGHRAAPLKG